MPDKLKIMVIDDEEIVGKRLKPALEKRGDIIESFVNSKEALARLVEEHFDIVITDIRMDEIDGLEVLDYIKSHSKDTKVIMITGYATVEVAREALAKGAFDFIAKPFKPEDLRIIINKAVKELNAEQMT
ncbi:response regulator [bacterium BMS3Abin03]|jgi:DNA-binding NtrC family response regulator|nr:response regulator [bacterium BMS3Abin03]MCG6961443.1 response regulator [bacterium BMS3Abin03]